MPSSVPPSGRLIHATVGSAGGVGDLADEPLGVGGVGGVEYLAALFSDELRSSVVDVGGGVEPDARMAVVVVVPVEEPSTVGVGVLEGAEASSGSPAGT